MNHMINKGWLCKPDLFQVFTEFNVDSVSFDSSGQDFSLDDLSLTLNTPKRNELIAKTWLEEAQNSKYDEFSFKKFNLFVLITKRKKS